VAIDVLGQLSEAGVSVWLDDISRERLRTGNLQMLIDDFHVVGVTSNPTIFAKALSSGDAYDAQIADLKIRGVDVGEASRLITTYDIRWACDVFKPVYERTGGLDGRVSLEVDPRLARETAKSIAEARSLWWMVDRPNLLIKIPATLEGLPAITQCIAEGISVNVTLIFALERYDQVIDAYMAGLEQAAAAGHDLSQIRSVASFFVSRVDTEVDDRLDKIGTPEAEALRGKAAVANARLAYELFEQRTATDRWQALSAQGANIQRPLWASTSVNHVRRRPGGGRHGEHHARRHDAGHRRPRQAPRRHRARHLRRVPADLRRPGEARYQLRRRRKRPRGPGRAEVRGVVE
jgi:transaldolase